jgi:hypothetical protein
MPPARRSRGSARFAPYFKVQWRDPVSMTWRDVQRAHPSEAEARAAFLPERECRVMRISEEGRRPLP